MQNVINFSGAHRYRGRGPGFFRFFMSIPIPIPTPTPKGRFGSGSSGLEKESGISQAQHVPHLLSAL